MPSDTKLMLERLQLILSVGWKQGGIWYTHSVQFLDQENSIYPWAGNWMTYNFAERNNFQFLFHFGGPQISTKCHMPRKGIENCIRRERCVPFDDEEDRHVRSSLFSNGDDELDDAWHRLVAWWSKYDIAIVFWCNASQERNIINIVFWMQCIEGQWTVKEFQIFWLQYFCSTLRQWLFGDVRSLEGVWVVWALYTHNFIPRLILGGVVKNREVPIHGRNAFVLQKYRMEIDASTECRKHGRFHLP